MSNEIVVSNKQTPGIFSPEAFEFTQRVAKAFASSDIVPEKFKGNLANCIVALEVAKACNVSPMAVFQNLHVIQGRPSWSSSYIIAALNACGRFAPLRFEMSGQGDDRQCVAWTKDSSGERLDGPAVSIKMAKDEGWYQKNGSKWKTMPELMLRYRAAAFFGRLYAPDVLNGMQSEDEVKEVIDVTPITVEEKPVVAAVNEKIKTAKRTKIQPAQAPVIETVQAVEPIVEPAQEARGEQTEEGGVIF